MAELWQMSGLDLGAAIASKKVSSTEVLDAVLVGLQIVGRPCDEATVLRASARFEEARPWGDKWPEV